MPNLPLAIEIADTLSTADMPIDVDVKADELLKAHPDAEASREDIREVLESESHTETSLTNGSPREAE
jgi:hypothetical protein